MDNSLLVNSKISTLGSCVVRADDRRRLNPIRRRRHTYSPLRRYRRQSLAQPERLSMRVVAGLSPSPPSPSLQVSVVELGVERRRGSSRRASAAGVSHCRIWCSARQHDQIWQSVVPSCCQWQWFWPSEVVVRSWTSRSGGTLVEGGNSLASVWAITLASAASSVGDVACIMGRH
jgi:hypothetical protein